MRAWLHSRSSRFASFTPSGGFSLPLNLPGGLCFAGSSAARAGLAQTPTSTYQNAHTSDATRVAATTFMRVAIHAGTLRGSGSAAVGQALLRELLKHDDLSAVVWCPQEWIVPPSKNLLIRETRGGTLRKLETEVLDIPRQIRAATCDVLLSMTDTSSPFVHVPHVLFVQQAFLAYPRSQLAFQGSKRFSLKADLMAAYFRVSLRSVRLYTVQTHDMKARLCARWGLPAGRVLVIPSSVADDVLERVGAASRSSQPYLIYVAGPGLHKNHSVLPPTLRALQDPDVKLGVTLTVGDLPSFDDQVRALRLQHQVEYLGQLSRPALLAAMAKATVAVIPSQLESFGLAYYEALALGLPIVAADKGFAREACGPAALYADNDPEGYATQIAHLLGSEQAQLDARKASLARFAEVHVPWPEIGRRYLAALHGVLS